MRCEFQKPSVDLRDHVDFLVCMEWSYQAAHIRNFPPAQLSVFFNFGDDIYVRRGKAGAAAEDCIGRENLYPRMMLEGLRTVPSDYITPGKTGIVIAALKPTARTSFLHFGGDFALRDNIALAEVFGSRLPDIPGRLAATKKFTGKFAVVEQFLRDFLRPVQAEPRVEEAFHLVASNPHLSVETLSRKMGLSKRHFDRIFQAGIGTSPKHYARVLRLQHSLQLINNPALSLTHVAHEAGFHDQSHFIRDFKGLTGFTPSAYRTRQIDSQAANRKAFHSAIGSDSSPPAQQVPANDGSNPMTIACDGNLIIPAA